MKVSAIVLASCFAALVSAGPPSKGPSIHLLSLPYKKCSGRYCEWINTGAIIDTASINYAGNGIVAIPGGVQITGAVGDNRFYIINDKGTEYEQFYLKNHALSIDVDLSHVACGYNAAFYFSHLPTDVTIGTGYCDAQNTCIEFDILESNIAATATTSHSCNLTSGACDPWGCGIGTAKDPDVAPTSLVIDTTKPFTVTTYFYTHDKTDSGLLSKVSQSFTQGYNVHWLNSSLTDAGCEISSGSNPYWNITGKFPAMSWALGKGMTAVFSLWGSGGDGMSWLDGGQTNPRCAFVEGEGNSTAADNIVKFSNIAITKL